MQKGTCRSCGAPLLWIRTSATDSLMPLDAEPVRDGNIILVDGKAHVMRGDLFEDMLEGPRYVSHHATCPQSAQHRRKR